MTDTAGSGGSKTAIGLACIIVTPGAEADGPRMPGATGNTGSRICVAVFALESRTRHYATPTL
jgi:hypothetical protein